MKVAAIVYFEDGATVEDVKAILNKLKDQLDANPDRPGTALIERVVADEYDPSYGSPVWYIP